MLKGKLKFSEKARKRLPDRIGSLVAAFEVQDRENGGIKKEFQTGEELETFLPDGISLRREMNDHNDCFEHNASNDIENKIQDLGPLISGLEIINDSEWSELDHELAQDEINVEKLRRIACRGLPDGGGFRATTWKLLLGYLPTSRDLWGKELSENRSKYAKLLKEELLLSLVHAEADSFSCFVILLSDSMDHFSQQMDHSSTGILSTLSKLSELLKANDEELWQHLEFTTKVNPQFYAFRWITLLLTQEFSLPSILRTWDCLLSNPYGIQEMLLRVCVAMLLCAKGRLMNGDFVDNLRLLQHYPDINIDHLLHVAQTLIPATTSSHL